MYLKGINSCNKKLFTAMVCLFNIVVMYAQENSTITGTASYYHHKFNSRKTANGEIFYNDSLTAAHKTLPFGTIVIVTHIKNKKTVKVRINDRLPSTSTRAIDLSQAAAREINMIKSGLAKVSMEIILPDTLIEIDGE